MGINQQHPKNSNEQIDEKGLLQPESNNHTLYVMPPDASSEEQHALQTLSRLNDQLEQSSPPSEARAAKPTGKSSPKRKRPSRRKRFHSGKSPHKSTDSPDLVHESRCSVCRHELRADIEEEFIHWHSPRNIAEDYGISARAVYRHAHALNLFALRDRNLRSALGNVIDRVDRVPAMTPDAIIKAIHAFARVNGEGQWVEPPKYLVISQGLPVPFPANATGIVALGDPSPAASAPIGEPLPPPQLPPASIDETAKSAQPALADTPPEEKKIFVPRAWPNTGYMVLPANPELPR